MGKTMKKILCSVLVVLMCLTSAPLSGFVGLDLPELPDLSEWFSSNAIALSDGYYKYKLSNNKATITDVDISISGDITIPSTLGGYRVTTIGTKAFYECGSITSVTIPDTVTTIGTWAFAWCKSLTSATIPDSVTTIGVEAFEGCKLLSVTIPDSVTKIGEGAFYDCHSLISVTIGDSVTTIGKNVFRGCGSLTSITIPDSVITIGGSAFRECYSLESVSIGDSVTAIGAYNFAECYSLKNVTIGDSVTSIGAYAFDACSNLTSIIIPDSVTTIGAYAFSCCFNLAGVIIPDSVTTIGTWAFYGCALTGVTIPDSVTTIGEGAFLLCDSLTSVTIGDSVTSIGKRAFNECKSLASITVDENNTAYSSDGIGVLFDKNKTILIQYPIGNAISSYAIPNSVTTIGDAAFGYCDSLTSVTIGDSVTSISDSAFFLCDSLTSITIPNSVKTIGASAFFKCEKLTDVYYGGTEDEWNEIHIDSFGNDNDCLLDATIHYNYSDDTPQIPEHNAKHTIHTFAPQPKLIMGYGDAMTMKFELECHNLDTGENFLVSDPNFSLSSSDTDIFTVENIEKDGQITSARLVSENPGNAILTVGAYANGKLVESLQYLIAVEGECVYHIDTLINGKGDKDYNLYSYSNGIHIDNLDYVETGEECNLSFDVYNSVNCIAAVEVYSADGELLATKSISAFDGTLPTGIWDTLKQMYEFADKDYSNISYKDKEYSTKTEVTLLGVPTDGHIKITTDVEDSWACAFYNISDLLVDSAFKIIDLAFETEDARKKATEKLTDQMLDKIMNDDNLKKVFEEIIRKYFQSVKIGSKEEIRDSLEEYVIGIESLDIDIGEIILDVLKGMGISVAETVISFLLGPVKGFVETIFAVISISKLIDHGTTVEELRGSRGSEIYFKRYASAIRYSNGYHINNSEPFPDDVSFHTYKILSGDTYNIATSNFADATYVDVISMALYKDGKETPPNGSVQVAIPIPDGMNIFSFKVYRQEIDGSFEQLDCDFSNVNDGYIYITTDHFSVYCIVGDIIEPESLYFKNAEYNIEVGKGLIPRPKFSPENADAVDYSITSSNEHIAKVFDSGLLVGVTEGSAVVTVKAENGISANFVVNVIPEPCSEHIYGDKDVNCKNCGYDRTENCSCNCHASGIKKFFFNFILFFQKLFKKNAVCACGVAHY